MIGKAKISSITRLHQKKFRDESGLFIVEGIKSVRDLLNSKLQVEELFATKEWLASDECQLAGNSSVTEVLDTEMERISAWKNPQPVLAIAHQPHYGLEDVDLNQPIMMLDDLRDPGNMGTIIRTADWFGIRQLVCSESTVELFNPKVIQATMGSFTRVRVFYTDLPHFINTKLQGRRIFGAFLEGISAKTIQFNPSDIIIIGNEANGISEKTAAKVTDKILIDSPIKGYDKPESLNAAIAAAIMMYQFQ